ncbi:MAG: DUF5679 domain-containing protein [Sulfolobales archaeon]|nr:DUF5679 domain-containing protein [Sulfolobales archaeon]MDW8083469.1 DUF5679 domain-containing protein [Sulfolobales archaeon]
MAQVVGPAKGPVTGFCVKCRTKRELKSSEEVVLKNGRRAIRGACSVCGTMVYVFMGSRKKG